MKLVHISDWHLAFDQFEPFLGAALRYDPPPWSPDVIIVTGDMLRNFQPSLRDLGNEGILQEQILEQVADGLDRTWPNVPIIGVRGNHDWCDYNKFGIDAFDKPGHDEPIRFGGEVFYGFRGVVQHAGFWQDEMNERQLDALCQTIPRDTTILVTHTPPIDVLDSVTGDRSYGRHIGSVAVRDASVPFYQDATPVKPLPNLKAHLFGHVHEMGGNIVAIGGVQFSNAAYTLNYLEV